MTLRLTHAGSTTTEPASPSARTANSSEALLQRGLGEDPQKARPRRAAEVADAELGTADFPEGVGGPTGIARVGDERPTALGSEASALACVHDDLRPAEELVVDDARDPQRPSAGQLEAIAGSEPAQASRGAAEQRFAAP
jgi:hypothetical protein